jgi:uncharacterized delta-60 repeat protein
MGENEVPIIGIECDGKIVIGGDFATVNGVKRRQIARLLADGALDASFDPGDGPNSHVGVVIQQPDGKIVIGGFFTMVDGQNRNYFSRLNGDGSLDVTFDPRVGADSFVYALALQPDNQLLIAGSFGNIDGQARSHIARVFNNLSGPAIELIPAKALGSLNLVLQPDARLQGTVETSEDLLT